MKYYDCDDNIFCFNQNQVEIYIEIHDEIYDYLEKYPILNFCQLHNVKLSSLLDEQIMNKKKVQDSKIQIVAKIFQKLKRGQIGVSNIKLDSTDLIPLNS